MRRSQLSLGLALAALLPAAETSLPPLALDLRDAVVVAPAGRSAPARQAVVVLVEETARRSGLRWPVMTTAPASARAAIVIGPRDPSLPSEGYRLATQTEPARVTLTAADDRGVLYGIGHLLRSLALGTAPARAGLGAALNVTSAPRYPIRGMQLGFRAMSNTYGNWELPQFDQQIRDLAVFGGNAIELVAGFDREAPGDLTMPSLDNMAGVSGLAASYGLDVWLWTPAREHNYSDPALVARTLGEWEKIFRAVPRIDGIYVPGGDPGDTPPELLLPLAERQAALLRKYHPRAGVWISVQGFNRAHLDYFFDYLRTRQPDWLAGVIQSSWTDLTIAQIRERTPARYPIRSCVDIGHVLHCMYPVHELDTAFALTEGREPICPRPEAMQAIARAELPLTRGSIAYSDGVTDDINKTLWLQLAWNPDAVTGDVLRDYGRYFIGERFGDAFAAGAAMLEKNWQGPLAVNAQVAATLAHFKELERQAATRERRNWRFLSGLYRAYYDAFTQHRLRYETALEAEATAALGRAATAGAEPSMREAEAILERAVKQPVAFAERTRVFQLGEALYQTIGMKLSVPLCRATAPSRGANLDSIDWPLNNRVWLKTQFTAIRRLPDEPARIARLRQLAHWTDPGPGGFYDDPGQPGTSTRAPIGTGWASDPGYHSTAHAMKNWVRGGDFATHRIAWMDHVGTLGDTPLVLTYDALDPQATYELRVVYGDTKLNGAVRLTANEAFEIHPFRKGPVPAAPQTFALPRAATATGRLVLQWERDPALASIRGVCHVSEIWLIKK